MKRYAKCPVCGIRTVLDVPPHIVEGAKRFPYTIRVKHKDHYFYINLDSNAWITDILHPELVE
ncbi:MAG: hypothetical protein BAJATHORv1_10142 [Candidatus Thorarchaeota archaeon]|nr:MAG: hypothetical protein BAJATHORv1_10142 [Candidatus Thorarchaeota archaeon]